MGALIGNSDSATKVNRPVFLLCLLVFLLAWVLRAWFSIEVHPPIYYEAQDMAWYAERARHLLSFQSSGDDTFLPLGYPLFMAFVELFFRDNFDSIGGVQALLSSLSCVLATLISFRMHKSLCRAALVGGLMVVYFPGVFYSGLFLTETLFGFLLLLCACFWLQTVISKHGRAWAMATGFSLGLAIMVRANFVLILPLLAYWFFKQTTRRMKNRIAIVCVAALPLILATITYNSILNKQVTGLSTNGGVNFFLAHCDCVSVKLTTHGPLKEISSSRNRRYYQDSFRADAEPTNEAYFYKAALSQIAEKPIRMLYGFSNIAEGFGLSFLQYTHEQPYWPGLPSAPWLNRLFGMVGCLLSTLSAVLLATSFRQRQRWRTPRHASSFIALTIGSLLLTFFFFIGDPRLRVPFDPIFILFLSSIKLRSLRNRTVNPLYFAFLRHERYAQVLFGGMTWGNVSTHASSCVIRSNASRSRLLPGSVLCQALNPLG